MVRCRTWSERVCPDVARIGAATPGQTVAGVETEVRSGGYLWLTESAER